MSFQFETLYPILTLAKVNVVEMKKFTDKEKLVEYIKQNPQYYVVYTKQKSFVANDKKSGDLLLYLDSIKDQEFYLQPRIKGIKVNIFAYFEKQFDNPSLCYERRGFFLIIPCKSKDFRLYNETLGKIEGFMPSQFKDFLGLKIIVVDEKKFFVIDCFNLKNMLQYFTTLYLDLKRMKDIIEWHKILKNQRWI